MDSDPQLEQAFRAWVETRDEDALARLVTLATPRAYALARRMLGSHVEAEDAVQEALMRLLRTDERYREVPLHARLGYLVHREALVALRRRRRRRHHEEQALSQPPTVPADIDHEALQAAVAALPEQQRSVIALHYYAGLSQAEAAQVLGLSVNAFGVRIHRAREHLRALLERRGVTMAGSALALSLARPPTETALPAITARLTQQLMRSLRAPPAATTSAGALTWSGVAAAGSAVVAALAVTAGFYWWPTTPTTAPALTAAPARAAPEAPTLTPFLHLTDYAITKRAPARPNWFRPGPEQSAAWIFVDDGDRPCMRQRADQSGPGVEFAIDGFAVQRAVGARLALRWQPGATPGSVSLCALGPTSAPGCSVHLDADGTLSIVAGDGREPVAAQVATSVLDYGWFLFEAEWRVDPGAVRARWWPATAPVPAWQLQSPLTILPAARGPVSLRITDGRIEVGDLRVRLP